MMIHSNLLWTTNQINEIDSNWEIEYPNYMFIVLEQNILYWNGMHEFNFFYFSRNEKTSNLLS